MPGRCDGDWDKHARCGALSGCLPRGVTGVHETAGDMLCGML